jgi:hypothetical protein
MDTTHVVIAPLIGGTDLCPNFRCQRIRAVGLEVCDPVNIRRSNHSDTFPPDEGLHHLAPGDAAPLSRGHFQPLLENHYCHTLMTKLDEETV